MCISVGLLLFIYQIMTTSQFGKVGEASKTSLTLKEATQKGLNEALTWNKHAKIVSVSSVDDKSSEKNKGVNGERNDWNLIFGLPEKDRSLIVAIRSNVIIESAEVKETVLPSDVFSMDQVRFDSTDFVKEAVEEYRLKPGEEWAEGYHFTLSKSDDQLFFAVVGLNQDNKFTKIYFDPETGKFLGSESNKH